MATGITEIISQFAGYLHLHNETARLRLSYEEFAAQRLSEDFNPERFQDGNKLNPLGELDTVPRYSSSAPQDASAAAHQDFHIEFQLLDNELSDSLSPALPSDLRLLAPLSSPGGALNLIASEPRITVTYDKGGDQAALQAHEQNKLWDNDRVAPKGAAVDSLQLQDGAERLEALNQQADAELASGLVLPGHDTASLIAFASERDAAWKADGDTVREEVEPGVYVNGELQPDDAVLPDFPRSGEDETAPYENYPADVPAQIATLGSNLAVNSALIVDVNHATGTLVVMGDYYRTDAIVQVNLYYDSDSISYAGAGGFDITSQGNETFNIATFLDTDPGVPSFAGGSIFAGLNWNVDVFEGDLSDVKLITQINWMYDNDIAVQSSYESNYQLLMGANDQGNFASFVTLAGNYDLVIVLGDYHELNFIYQKNVLLDPDTLKVLGYAAQPGGEDATGPSISSGGNWLQNDATIEQFGTSSYQEITPEWQDLADRLLAGDSDLDVSYGFGIPNFGASSFDVLVVTGSMYDINVIGQENVIADADVALQYLPAAAEEGAHPVTQTVTSGDNALGNFAAIVNTGPAADYYVGGDLYEDEMLIQSDIVVADNDQITREDPGALANELVAFTTPADDTGAEEEPLQPPDSNAAQYDLLGNVLT